MSTSSRPDNNVDDHPQGHNTRDGAPWIATFDDPDEQNEVTFQPRDVDIDKLASEWITVNPGDLVNVGDYQ